MYTIVTGAAGFIGSNIVKALNERGVTDIIAVDNLKRADKFKNLVDCEVDDYLDKNQFIEILEAGHLDGAVDAILHQGACSDTMEQDGHYMMENNFRYSSSLLEFCARPGSAADLRLVGLGLRRRFGVSASRASIEGPLNVYGYSKFLFDQIVRRRLPEGFLADRRPALLQRLRSARAAQGPHGLGGLPPLQPVQGRRQGQAVRRHRRLCERRPEPRLHLRRRRGQGQSAFPRQPADLRHLQLRHPAVRSPSTTSPSPP